MPNRIIKESICVSDSINELSWFEEVLFYRLIVSCDDYGRFDGRIAVIKNRLFPLKEGITVKNVENAINKLVSVGLVTLYVFEGKPFLYLPTWNEHQNIRAKRSKYPSPDDVKSSECICMQMNANVPVIQSESNPNPNPNPNPREARFEEFWRKYPKKVGKGAAEKAFDKIKPTQQVFERMLSAIEKQKNSAQWKKDNGQYIPNPATWLNQQRWEDEVTSASVSSTGYEDFDQKLFKLFMEGT